MQGVNLIVLLLAVLLANVQSFSRFPVSKALKSSSSLFNKLKDEPIPANESDQQMRERLRRKARKMMFNENGVAYAPWIAKQIDEDAIVEDLIRKEGRGESARSKAKSGSIIERGEIEASEGMRWRMKDNQVELAWITTVENDNKGYIVEKRPSYGGDFQEVASFKEVTQLVSKGLTGGRYKYADPSASEGSWIYRVQDCDTKGKKNVLAQCFVEVQTEGESKSQGLVAIVLGGVLAVAAVVGYALDPPL